MSAPQPPQRAGGVSRCGAAGIANDHGVGADSKAGSRAGGPLPPGCMRLTATIGRWIWAEGIPRLRRNALLWIDLEASDEAGLEAAAELLELPAELVTRLSSEDVRLARRLRGPYPRAHGRGQQGRRPGRATHGRSSGRNWLLTRHGSERGYSDSFRDAFRGETELGRLDSLSFLAALLEHLLGHYFAAIEGVEQQVEAFDENAMQAKFSDGEEELARIVVLRRTLATLRRSLVLHRETYTRLGDPHLTSLASEASANRARDLLARLERAVDAAESARQMVTGSFEILMTRSSQRTNDTMKLLTLISAALLPSAVIAGVLGMNFEQAFSSSATFSGSLSELMVGLILTVGLRGPLSATGSNGGAEGHRPRAHCSLWLLEFRRYFSLWKSSVREGAPQPVLFPPGASSRFVCAVHSWSAPAGEQDNPAGACVPSSACVPQNRREGSPQRCTRRTRCRQVEGDRNRFLEGLPTMRRQSPDNATRGTCPRPGVLAGCGGDDADEAIEQAETVAEGVAEEAEEAIDTATGEAAEAVEDVTETAGDVVSEAEVSIDLGEQNASGQSGTATLSPNDDGTVHVSLEISNPPAEAQPAHIHQGTCAELDPTPAFPLESIVNGSSETDVTCRSKTCWTRWTAMRSTSTSRMPRRTSTSPAATSSANSLGRAQRGRILATNLGALHRLSLETALV